MSDTPNKARAQAATSTPALEGPRRRARDRRRRSRSPAPTPPPRSRSSTASSSGGRPTARTRSILVGEDVSSKQFVEKIKQAIPDMLLVADTTSILDGAQDEQKAHVTPNPYDGAITAEGQTGLEHTKTPHFTYCRDIWEKATGKKVPSPNVVVKLPNGKHERASTARSRTRACSRTFFTTIAKKVGPNLNVANWATDRRQLRPDRRHVDDLRVDPPGQVRRRRHLRPRRGRSHAWVRPATGSTSRRSRTSPVPDSHPPARDWRDKLTRIVIQSGHRAMRRRVSGGDTVSAPRCSGRSDVALVVALAACGSSSKSSSAGRPRPTTTVATRGDRSDVEDARRQGVTDNAIKIGVAIIDFKPIQQFIDFNHGDEQAIDPGVHRRASTRPVASTAGKLDAVYKTYTPIGSDAPDRRCARRSPRTTRCSRCSATSKTRPARRRSA